MIGVKSVLVTGATGFVGRSVTRLLASRGWQVTTSSRQNIPGMYGEHLSIDLEDVFSLQIVRDSGPYDAIVHLGARIGWDGSSEAEMFFPNVVASGILAKYARDWNAHFVFASAALLHGAGNPRITDNSPVNPDMVYTKTKWLAEQLVGSVSPSHTIMRIGGVFGADGPRHLGINRAIENALNGESLQYTGTGKALRNYIYVEDVAIQIATSLENRTQGIHLVAGTETLSIKEMLVILADRFLSGRLPQAVDGLDADDQLISASPIFPQPRSFKAAIDDIHERFVAGKSWIQP